MCALGSIEAQCPCNAFQSLGRNANIASLFEPGVPSQADTRELSDFFTAQAGRSPPARAKAAIRRIKADTARLQELCQGTAVFIGAMAIKYPGSADTSIIAKLVTL
jgi:hypothetical protein